MRCFMKSFKLTPLSTAIIAVLSFVPVSSHAVPKKGDLDIYSSGNNADKNPTIMLVVEASTYTNPADGISEVAGETEIVPPRWTYSVGKVPRYKRLGYYMGLSNPAGWDESKIFPTRLTRMKDALFYLMDEPGLLPDNYRIGLTRYSGGTVVKDFPNANGEGATANVVVPAKELGPIRTDYLKVKSSTGDLVKVGEKYIQIQQGFSYGKNALNGDYFPLANGIGKYSKKENAYYRKITSGGKEKYVLNARGDYKVNPDTGKYVKVGDDDFVATRGKTRYTQTCEFMGEGGKKQTSHRCEIKKYVAAMCDSDLLCTGESPMGAAYAEAGAYMMGTKTSRLVLPPNSSKEEDLVWTRVLRKKKNSNVWQYCPPEHRTTVGYQFGNTEKDIKYREECPDTVEEYNQSTGKMEQVSAWKTVNDSNVAHWYWAGPDNKATKNRLKAVRNDDGTAKYKYDLLWYNGLLTKGGGLIKRPYGTSVTGNRLTSKDLAIKKYDFKKDPDFNNRNPTTNAAGIPINEGADDPNYEYWVDKSADARSGLYPQILYRPFRRSLYKDGKSAVWQFCDYDKAKLYDYDYSMYRVTCKEEDWREVTHNSSYKAVFKDKPSEQVKLKIKRADGTFDTANVEWNCGFWPDKSCNIINKPLGTDGRLTNWKAGVTESSKAIGNFKFPSRNAGRLYLQDSALNPFDGWQYFYDVDFKSEIKLPPTLPINYGSSGVRNSPPEVRGDKSYTYDKPNYSECSGTMQYNSSGETWESQPQTIENAILFITAGYPYSSKPTSPTSEMNMSLSKADATTPKPVGGKGVQCPTTGERLKTDGIPINDYWNCIGEYSKHLRMADAGASGAQRVYVNPAQTPIKTGVFLFSSPKNTSLLPPKGYKDGVKLYNCDAAEIESLTSACKLGQYGEGYGEGGFFLSTSKDPKNSYKELANAIVKLAENLDAGIGMVPSSLPVVPSNDLQPNVLQPYAYLPIFEPSVKKKNAHWPGNLRKYKVGDKGYVGRDGKSPYSDKNNAILSVETQGWWSKSKVKSVDQAGGVYASIPTPVEDPRNPNRPIKQRRVFFAQKAATEKNKYAGKVEEIELTTTSVNKVKVFDTNTDADDKNNTIRRLLLNYKGYALTEYLETAKDGRPATTNKDITDSETFSNQMIGGVNHSTPISLVTEGTIQEDGKLATTKNYILFGAMDNALHVIDDSNGKNGTGEEKLSIFFKEVMKENGQYKSITPELLAKDDGSENLPSFGLDGPWESYIRYKVDENDSKKFTAEEVNVFGGARLGGKVYYGLDLTDMDNPKSLFTITNEGDFDRLGYTWAKPVITNIKWQGKPRRVAILSGGYDTAYDLTDANRAGGSDFGTKRLGNAIYVVDAQQYLFDSETGEWDDENDNVGNPLIIISDAGSNADNAMVNANGTDKGGKSDVIKVKNSHLKYSIPASVKVLDRDADELTDHIYFADLEGQVFRVDINNKVSKITPAVNAAASDVITNPAVRAVRIANLNENMGGDGKATGPGPRFYETPAVTIQKNDDDERFATVSLASGDRSNPLYDIDTYKNDKGELPEKMKVANKPNYTYTIYDKDVAQKGLFFSDYKIAGSIKVDDNLVDISQTKPESNYSKSGWRSPLNTFGSEEDKNLITTNAIKSMGPLTAVANKLFVSTYNPNDGRTDETGCTAQVLGSSEIYQFCLPYGICDASKGKQFQRVLSGKGILGIRVGSDEKGFNRKLLTQTGTIDSGGSGGGSGGGSDDKEKDAPKFKGTFTFNGVMEPMLWYDYQSKKPE